MIAIINYNMGNIASIVNILKKVGSSCVVASSEKEIKKATKLILPGVGAFDQGKKQLKELNLIPILHQKVIKEKTPFLGICLGMQLLTKKSEEGKLPGIGWIDAITVKFKFGAKSSFKIPHMGWNKVKIQKKSQLFPNREKEQRFYFVHSYHVVCYSNKNILTTTNYGYTFVSSIEKDNIFGVQFHPEKSHIYGMNLFKNFIQI